MNLYKKYLILAFIALAISVEAQDMHFTQFYNVPMALNPAYAGKFRGDYRLSAVYRNQWKAANATFATTGFGADMNFRLPNNDKDKIGVGIFAVDDQLGDQTFKNQYINGAVSYLKTLDKKDRHKVGVGIQAGYVMKNLLDNDLRFGNQYVDGVYDPTKPTNEDMSATRMGYFNMNLGAFYDYVVNPNMDLYIGGSLFNVTSPKESVADGSDKRLGSRFSSNIGMNYRINMKWSVLPSFLIMRQTGATDFNVGSAIGYTMLAGTTNQTTLLVGGWYRIKDAIMPMIGLNYKNMQFGVSYDATTSRLNEIKNYPGVKNNAVIGAIEFTLIYIGNLNRPHPTELTIPCRFF